MCYYCAHCGCLCQCWVFPLSLFGLPDRTPLREREKESERERVRDLWTMCWACFFFSEQCALCSGQGDSCLIQTPKGTAGGAALCLCVGAEAWTCFHFTSLLNIHSHTYIHLAFFVCLADSDPLFCHPRDMKGWLCRCTLIRWTRTVPPALVVDELPSFESVWLVQQGTRLRPAGVSRQLRFVFITNRIICCRKNQEEANEPSWLWFDFVQIWSGFTVETLFLSLEMPLLYWKLALTEVTLTSSIQKKLPRHWSVLNTTTMTPWGTLFYACRTWDRDMYMDEKHSDDDICSKYRMVCCF